MDNMKEQNSLKL